jgi:hypothetical protein
MRMRKGHKRCPKFGRQYKREIQINMGKVI